MRRIVLIALALPLGGCIARTAADVVTFPVRATSYGYDKLTTSQEEADRKRGREMRKQEAREEKERRRDGKEQAKARRDGYYRD